jgi:hypothetical protein
MRTQFPLTRRLERFARRYVEHWNRGSRKAGPAAYPGSHPAYLEALGKNGI